MRRGAHSNSMLLQIATALVPLIICCQSSLAQPSADTPSLNPNSNDSLQSIPESRSRKFARGLIGNGGPSLSMQIQKPVIAYEMGLSEDQQRILREIESERVEFIRNRQPGGNRFEEMEKLAAKFREFDLKVAEILTEEQLAIWEEWKADKASRGPQSDSDRQKLGLERIGDTQVRRAPVRRMDFNNSKPPVGVAVAASFHPLRVNNTTTKMTGRASRIQADASLRVSFNFRYAMWTDVLKLLAEVADLALDLDTPPSGTLTYFDETQHTVGEAINVLNGYLLPKGFVLVGQARRLTCLNWEDGIPTPLIPVIDLDELSECETNEILNLTIPAIAPNVGETLGELKALVGPWGHMTLLKATNSIEIIDTGSNLRRIVRILKLSSKSDDRLAVFQSISMKHISAVDAERTIRQLIELDQSIPQSSQSIPPSNFRGQIFRPVENVVSEKERLLGASIAFPLAPAASGLSLRHGKIQILSNTRSNSILVAGSPSIIKLVQKIVLSIDVETKFQTSAVATSDETAFLREYRLESHDPIQFSNLLRLLLPGRPIVVDANVRRIRLVATQIEHSEVDRLISESSSEDYSTVMVFNLSRLDPIPLSNSLRNIFRNDSHPLAIEPDARGRRLLVRGSASQIAQFKELLWQIEAIPNPGSTVNSVIKLDSMKADSTLEDLMPAIRHAWEASIRSSIRVVIPSIRRANQDVSVDSTNYRF